MSAKSVCLGGLVAAFLGAGLARAQGTSPTVSGQPSGLETGPTAPGAIISDAPRLPGNVPFYSGPQSLQTPGTETSNQPVPARVTLSSWLLYPRSQGCCCPTGGCGGPIAAELFFNIGPSFNVSGGVFGHELGVGWDIEGGARSLFFNPECDAAWTVSFSVSNNNNHANDQNEQIFFTGLTAGQTGLVSTSPITGLPTINTARAQHFGIDPATLDGTTSQVIPRFPVTIKSLNRTYVNLGFGRDWYLWGPARVEGMNQGELPNWRIGAEFGGRYGTGDVVLNEIQNRSDSMGGLYVALYSDVECPWHCCVWTFGVRVQYAYTWDDIFQHQNLSDLQDVNLLLTFGVRF